MTRLYITRAMRFTSLTQMPCISQGSGTLDNFSEMETHNKLLKNGYSFSKYKETDWWKRKYWKKVKK
jgi:hypothetical protein